MKKITYGTIREELSEKTTKVQIEAKGKAHEIEVLTYLPIKDKMRIISTIVPLSVVDGLVRYDVVETLLNLSLVQEYAGITFSDKIKEDPFTLYDEIKVSGLLNQVIGAIPESEKDFLGDAITSAVENLQENIKYSVNGIVGQQKAQEQSAEVAKDFLSNLIPNAEK